MLICGAFIFLLPVRTRGHAGRGWSAVVIGRELLITGVRGFVESLGKKFGADWLGKLKMILQCAWLLAVLVYLTIREQSWAADFVGPVEMLHYGLIYAMLAATVLSGLQYCWQAAKLMSS